MSTERELKTRTLTSFVGSAAHEEIQFPRNVSWSSKVSVPPLAMDLSDLVIHAPQPSPHIRIWPASRFIPRLCLDSFINTTVGWVNLLLLSSSGPIKIPVDAW